jgi:hypothetical protein
VPTARSERSRSQRVGLMEVAREPKPRMKWCFPRRYRQRPKRQIEKCDGDHVNTVAN